MKHQMFSDLGYYNKITDSIFEKDSIKANTKWGFLPVKINSEEVLLSVLGKFQRLVENTPRNFSSTTTDVPTRFRKIKSQNRLIKGFFHPADPAELGVAKEQLQMLHREVGEVTSHLHSAATLLSQWEKSLVKFLNPKYSFLPPQYSDDIFLELLIEMSKMPQEDYKLKRGFLSMYKNADWVFNRNNFLQTSKTQQDRTFNQLDTLDQSTNTLSDTVSKTLRRHVPWTRRRESLTVPTLRERIYKGIEWIELYLFPKQLQSLSALIQETEKRKLVLLSIWRDQVRFLQNGSSHKNVFTLKRMEKDLELAKNVIRTPLSR